MCVRDKKKEREHTATPHLRRSPLCHLGGLYSGEGRLRKVPKFDRIKFAIKSQCSDFTQRFAPSLHTAHDSSFETCPGHRPRVSLFWIPPQVSRRILLSWLNSELWLPPVSPGSFFVIPRFLSVTSLPSPESITIIHSLSFFFLTFGADFLPLHVLYSVTRRTSALGNPPQTLYGRNFSLPL